MAWSGSGTFTRVHDWTADRDSGIKILASRMDTEDDGFATGINACLAKNGENAATGNLNLGGNRFTNASTSVSARSDLTPVAVVQDGSVCFATASGTDTYTASLSPTLTAYANGQTFRIKFTNANTGAASLDINGVGAVDIKKHNDQALVAGDIEANSVHTLVYNSTGPKFDLHSPANNFPLPVEAGGTGATSLDALAKIASSNTFTADQTITSTDAGQVGPTLKFYHNSASPAASDGVGYVTFNGKDAAGNETTYAKVFGEIVDTTDTSEDGRLAVQTVIAGSLASRAYIGAGIYTPNATGGDRGADTINASAIYDDGVQIVAPSIALYQNQQTSGTAGPNLSTGSWQTYPLTTEVYDPDGIGSLSSNQITLGAGTYEVYASASIQGISGPGVSTWRARLYNATDTAAIVQGPQTGALGTAVAGNVHVFGYFTLAGAKAIELQIYMASGDAGAITAMNTGDSEIYASVHVRKIA